MLTKILHGLHNLHLAEMAARYLLQRERIQTWLALRARRHVFEIIVGLGGLATLVLLLQVTFQAVFGSHHAGVSDSILKWRLSSPPPSERIIIIDIDEKSLAALAPQYGRWPWPRNVLADGLERLHELGAQSVLFNVLTSDPDKTNSDADLALEVTADLMPAVAFPLIRLNPQNDSLSAFPINAIPGVQLRRPETAESTVAVILPFMAPMQKRMGIANQRPDEDGIVRSYPLWWKEEQWAAPSIVAATLMQGGQEIRGIVGEQRLNWRNKQGRYRRISFSDLLTLAPTDRTVQGLRGAFVVVGVSAPGLGQTRATAVSALEDDNEILATALDDALHGTHLRMMPGWLSLLVGIVAIWVPLLLYLLQLAPTIMNKAFMGTQGVLGAITLVSVSYTVYVIDLSEAMTLMFGVFAVMRVVVTFGENWYRATPGYRPLAVSERSGLLVVCGFRASQISKKVLATWQHELERSLGYEHVIRVDRLFDEGTFLGDYLQDYECMILILSPEELLTADSLVASLGEKVHVVKTLIGSQWIGETHRFTAWVSLRILENCSAVMARSIDSDAVRP